LGIRWERVRDLALLVFAKAVFEFETKAPQQLRDGW
jgi:hypothetical protein